MYRRHKDGNKKSEKKTKKKKIINKEIYLSYKAVYTIYFYLSTAFFTAWIDQ